MASESKVIKFCSDCEEGFAERFSLCPNCGKEMLSFEQRATEKERILNKTEENSIFKQHQTASIKSDSGTDKSKKNDFFNTNQVKDPRLMSGREIFYKVF